MPITGFVLHRRFEKQYSKLDKSVKDAFRERMDIMLANPVNPILNNHPLHGELEGFRSINITGDIRAIYRLEGTVAVFLLIDSHSNLYG